jgi:hypothetical protein
MPLPSNFINATVVHFSEINPPLQTKYLSISNAIIKKLHKEEVIAKKYIILIKAVAVYTDMQHLEPGA